MKSLFYAVAVGAALSIPLMSYAQTNQPVTRAQVRAELVQLEKAGYNPASDQTEYPKNIQAAEARVVAQNDTAQADHVSYGADGAGSSQAGARLDKTPSAYSPPVVVR